MDGDWWTLFECFKVEKETFSDHLPITIKTQNNKSCSTRADADDLGSKILKWNKNKKEEYKTSMDALLQTKQNGSIANYLPLCDLESIVIKSATSIPKPGALFKKSAWYDRECEKLRKKCLALLNKLRKNESQSIRIDYLEANKYYKQTVKIKKRAHEEKLACELSQSKDAKEFWYLPRKLSGNYQSKELVSIPLERLRLHFESLLYQPVQITWSFAQPNIVDDLLDKEIRFEEVELVLNSLRDGKASGPDGIPAEFYKYSSQTFKENFAKALDIIYNFGTLTDQFYESLILPIYKKGDSSNPANYRGSTLLNSALKAYTTLLYKRLEKWVSVNEKLSEYQAGFRSGYSTVDNIFILTSIAQMKIDQNRKLYTFFVDFRAAFDMINRNAMFYNLYNLGISTKFVRALVKLYQQTKANIGNGKDRSERLIANRGVKQGCLVEWLTCGVSFDNTNVKVIMYADDIVILAESPSSLQLMINKLYQYCLVWGLEVNVEKSKVMIFQKGSGRTASCENWKYNEQKLEVVKKYNYLGMEMSFNLKIENHLKNKVVKAKSAICQNWKKIFSNNLITVSSKYNVFNATAKSIMFYGAQVWGIERHEDAESLLRFFLRKIFYLPFNTPKYMYHLESGLPTMFISALKLHADYLLRVVNKEESRLPKKILQYALQKKTLFIKNWVELAGNCGITINLTEANSNQWKKIFYEIIQLTDENERYAFIDKARSSTERKYYSLINYNLNENNYFKSCFSCYNIGIIFKIRGELIKLNFSPHRTAGNCSLCNLQEREDILHFIGVCLVLKEIRRHYFGKNVLLIEEVKTYLNGFDWQLLFNFYSKACAYRTRIITESF
ncbi:uncharacterized protein LOC129907145 [Episyrphus balteatus]|uniref:uncharacterized protein LOC129907145 n=1 Tax=Episyrphus balteatus TaxID=286459 RepID=UPI0024866D38|nr:uncharacterized protein LOC129907145 [Episyrphus balteatus]